MTNQEKLAEIQNALDTEYAMRQDRVHTWSLEQLATMNLKGAAHKQEIHGELRWRTDKDSSIRYFSVSAEGCTFYVRVGGIQYFSTTSYSDRDPTSESINTLADAAANTITLIELGEKPEFFQKLLKTYEAVLSSSDVVQSLENTKQLDARKSELVKLIRDEERIAEEQAIAAMRVVGAVLIHTQEGKRRFEMGLVTHVTPSRAKIEVLEYWLGDDETELDARTMLLENINKNRKKYIDDKYGENVSNANLSNWKIYQH